MDMFKTSEIITESFLLIKLPSEKGQSLILPIDIREASKLKG